METLLKEVERGVKNWYLPLLVGIILVAVGIWCIFTPLTSYLALSIVFAIGFFVSGIFETVFAIANKSEKWGWSLAIGIMSIILGILLMSNPALSAATLSFYVGFMLLFYSVTGISIASRIKEYYDVGWKTLMVVAILGVILSLIMLFNPGLAGITIVFWTAFAFISMGFFRIYIAFRLRKVKKVLKNMDKPV